MRGGNDISRFPFCRVGLPATLVLLLLLCGCFKPEREEIAGRGAREERKQLYVAPAEQLVRAGEEEIRSLEESRLPEEVQAIVVAEMSGFTMTLADLERRYNELPRHIRYAYGTPARLLDLLDHLLSFEVIAADARGRGLDRRHRVLTATKRAMASALLTNLLQTELKVAPVTTEEVRAEYDANPDRYYSPDTVKTLALAMATRTGAEKIRTKLTADEGATVEERRQRFEEAVAKHSVDARSRAQSGYLGAITSDGRGPYDVPPVLREAALELEVAGAISKVVSVGERHFILFLKERRPGQPLTLAEAEGTIRSRQYQARRAAAIERFVADLKSEADIQIDTEVLANEQSAHERSAGATPIGN